MTTTTLAKRGAAAALAGITMAAGLAVGGPAAASADLPQRATGAEARYTGGINDFSVTAKEGELVISANPYCNAWYSQCNAWVRYPGQSRRIINPRNGWSTAWPSGWRPGSSGTVEIGFYVVDVLGYDAYGQPPLMKTVTRPEQFVGLTAIAGAVDHAGKSVLVGGNATKGAEIRRNGQAVANSNGQWSATVGGLQVGSNTLTFDQYVNGVYRDSRSVTVVVDPPAPTLTATGSFPDDRTQQARISGVAAKGATVVFRSGGTIVGEVTANSADGSYVWDVPAPNVGGTKNYTVSQRVAGTESGNVGVPLDYGTAVSITSLEDGGDADSGRQPITGAGEDASSVTVSVNGTDLPAITVEGGRWSVEADLASGENTIVATQRSKGANTTTSTVTVNPGTGSVPAPTAAVEFGDALTDRARVTGTAEVGATVTVRSGAANGPVVGNPQVGADGRFSLPVNSPGAG
ncbi:MAG: Ig-like domain-containing protein, partial [Curtobacterium sp.]